MTRIEELKATADEIMALIDAGADDDEHWNAYDAAQQAWLDANMAIDLKPRPMTPERAADIKASNEIAARNRANDKEGERLVARDNARKAAARDSNRRGGEIWDGDEPTYLPANY